MCNRNHKPLKICHVKGWLSQDVTNYLKKNVSAINNKQKRLVRNTGKSNEWWEKVIRPPQCVTTQLGSVCALPRVVMSLSGNKVLMTLSNTPLLKLEPSIQLGQRPALPQRLPAPLWLPHSSIITQFFFLRSTHPAGYRGSAAAKTMQPTHLKDSDFLCHHPPRSLPSGSDHRASRETSALLLTLSLFYASHCWILHWILHCKNRLSRYCKTISCVSYACKFSQFLAYLHYVLTYFRTPHIPTGL